jgi:hypothetical protein
MRRLYRGAQAYVSFARVLSAAFYAVIALLLIGFALWLAYPFDRNWLVTGIAILVGFQGAAMAVKASEIFLSTKPAENSNRQQGHGTISRRDQLRNDAARRRGRPDR